MANAFFDSPPMLRGSDTDKLNQLYSYLGAMSTELNTALMTITIDQIEPETRQMIRQSEQNSKASKANYETLKSMIIKTAEIVRHEMDEIRTHLEDNYTALSSKFGEYERNLTNDITITAEGILQEYRFEERITDVTGNLDDFTNTFAQYIFTGLVDEENERYGIAIGEHVTNPDGTLNGAAKNATFTMDELAFWQGNVKMAWFTDNVMHVNNAEIEQTLKMGNHTWKILAGGALALVSG